MARPSGLLLNIEEKKSFTRGLQRDISNYCDRVASEACKKAAEDMNVKAMQEMNRFYDDYTPIFYDRTKDLYYNSYIKKYTTNASKFVTDLTTPGKKTRFGGVVVGSRLGNVDRNATSMSSYKDNKEKPLDPYEVFNAAYRGYHGPIFRPAKIMSVSPIDALREFARNKKDEWMEYGFKMARRHHYNTIGMYSK